MKKLISFLICLTMIIAICTPTFAAKSETNIVALDDGAFIVMTENENIRTTKLYQDGKVIEVFITNKIAGTITNPNTNKTMDIPIQPTLLNEPCITPYAGEYEYEFCKLGQVYYEDYSMTVGEITELISTAVTIVSITAVICGMTGFIKPATVSPLASQVLKLFQTSIRNHTVSWKVRWKCTKMWETNSYYPGGGFWFLGYSGDTTYFSYKV